jgi:hypothetical protein
MTYDYGGAVGGLVADSPFRRHPVAVELVVAVQNDEQRIGPWLRRVRNDLRGWSRSSAIVVVDRGSVDYTADEVANLPNDGVPVYLISSSEPGAAGWLGLAASSSAASMLAFATTASDPTSVSAVGGLLDQHTDMIAVTRGRAATGSALLALHVPWRSPEPMAWEGLADVDLVCADRDTTQHLARKAGRAHDLADLVKLAVSEGLTVHELRRYVRRGPMLAVHDEARGADAGAAESASA